MFFILCVMDAIEGRKVETFNILGTFMQTYQGGTLFLELNGVMVQRLLKINPGKYKKHIILFKGKEVLYVRLKKSLYGTHQGEMLS